MSAAPTIAWRPRANPWIIATSVMLATFMEVLDTSVANVALPHIAGSLAASTDDDEFRAVNPLIAIMQWWEANVPEAEKLRGSPEASLAEACRRFLLAHGEIVR